MTGVKYIIAILFSILFSYSFAQNNCGITIDTMKIYLDENLDDFISGLQTQKFNTSKDKSQIPGSIRQYLNCLTSDSFSIANPKEEYRCCCTSYQQLPKRKLLFFAESKGMFLITYLVGGVGVSTKILMLKLQDDKVIDLWTGYSFSEFKSKDQVVKYIKEKRKDRFGLPGSMAL
jgi:hypothetical protein